MKDKEDGEIFHIDGKNVYEHHKQIVDDNQITMRIDKFIVNQIANMTRNKIQKLADQGFVFVNDMPVKSSYKIKPKDVIVMAPDINQYAPSISAVFNDNIRYGIADRTDYDSSRLISAFLKILNLPSSRLTNLEVLDLLEIPSIARRFQLDETDRRKIETWIHETEIRWEYNGEEKSSRWHLPADFLSRRRIQ